MALGLNLLLTHFGGNFYHFCKKVLYMQVKGGQKYVFNIFIYRQSKISTRIAFLAVLPLASSSSHPESSEFKQKAQYLCFQWADFYVLGSEILGKNVEF